MKIRLRGRIIFVTGGVTLNKTCAVVLVLLFLSVGCDAREVHDAVYKAEDTLYSVKIIEVSNPPSLDIDCDYSNIEIYSWDDKKVKIEMTKRVKGVEDASELNNFDIQIVKDQDTIKLTSKYKGKVKSPFDRSVDVRAYLPKKIKKVSCKLDVGSVKFYDDIKGDIDVAVNMANIEINRIEGQLTLNGDMGDVRILNGVIRQGSSIRRNWGSIFLKAKLAILILHQHFL